MKKAIRILIPVFAVLAILFAIAVRFLYPPAPSAAEDEIVVNVRLDLDKDIGLFLVTHNVNGAEGSGGVSNADKSMLRKDSDDIYWSFEKWQLNAPADSVHIALHFDAVTKYYMPNYENVYPEEDVVPLGDVDFSANFGEVYFVTITGNSHDGYRAFLKQAE